MIRTASLWDAGLLASLNRDVQRMHARMEPGVFKADTDDAEVAAFFAARLARPEDHLRIFENADGPVGYVWFEVQERAETPLTLARRRIYVHHLSVREDARRRGIASALMDHVEGEALARGIVNIALDTWAANAAAQGFFASRGFVPFNILLGKRLSHANGPLL